MPDLEAQLRLLADHRAAQVPNESSGSTDDTSADTLASDIDIDIEAGPPARPPLHRGRVLVAAAVIIAVLGIGTAVWLGGDDGTTVAGPGGLPAVPARGLVERTDWTRPLDDLGTESTFVLARVGGDDPIQTAVATRALERFRPASTYKLVNALLFLEDGVVDGLFDDPLTWDGVDRGVAAWNRDQTLASALQSSAVWAFERWAAELDPDRVRAFLDETMYGNGDIGDGSGTYWLDGDLEISAVEQLAFLEAMVRGELPADQQAQADILGSLTAGPDLPSGGIRYKTGTTLAGPRPVAWLVGLVKTADGTWVFALNADLPRDAQRVLQPIPTEEREAVVMALLRSADIID